MSEPSSALELLIRLRDQLSKPLENIEKNLNRFKHSVEAAEEGSKKFKALAVTGAVFMGVSYELKEHLEKLVEAAQEFTSAQTDLEIATNASTDELHEFVEQAEEVQRATGLMAESVMGAQAALSKILGSSKEAIDALPVAADFAIAMHMKDAAAAAATLGSAYELIGDKSKPLRQGIQDVADKLTLLQDHYSLTKLNSEEFGRSFAKVAEAAQTMRTPINEVMAALGVLNLSGLGGGRGAGSVVQELLTTMGKLDKYGNPELWTKFGIPYSPDLMKQLEIFKSLPAERLSYFTKGIGEQGQAITILLKQYDRLAEAVKDFQNAKGTTEKEKKLVEGELGYEWDKLAISLQAFKVALALSFCRFSIR
jgi:hypothetical protein